MTTEHQVLFDHVSHSFVDDVEEKIEIMKILIKLGEITAVVEISLMTEVEVEGIDHLIETDQLLDIILDREVIKIIISMTQ